MKTLATLLNRIRDDHNRINDISHRLNSIFTRNVTNENDNGMPLYYSDVELLKYFTDDIFEVQKRIDNGDYNEENPYN